MSTPSIKVGQGNWGIKAGNLLGYANTEKKFSPVEFTSTRALNTATRVNASGNIEIVNANIPRIDYFGGQASLLVEPSAQNLAFHSETWTSGSNWNLNNNVTRATGSTNNFLAPDGTLTANAISPTSVNNIHYLFSNNSPNIAFTSGTIYTMSAFFKAGGTDLPVSGNAGRYVQMNFVAARFTQGGYANFDLQNGVVTASGGTTDANRSARIQNYGNGWYRCSFTATCNVDGGGVGVVALLITASGAPIYQTFSGTVTDVLYGWGAQLETGSVATSYIPTTTGSVTRNADVISVTGVAGLIGQTEGTIYAEVDVRNWVNLGRIFSISDGTSNNRIMTLFNTSNRFRVIVDVSGSSAQADISSASLSNGIHKIAVGYAANDVVFYVDGVLVGSDNTANIPACSQVFLGKVEAAGSTLFMNDRILDASIYQTRLPNTTTDGSPSLQSITTL